MTPPLARRPHSRGPGAPAVVAALIGSALLALPALLLAPLAFSWFIEADGTARSGSPLWVRLLVVAWLVIAALPVVALATRSWKVALVPLALSVTALGYCVWNSATATAFESDRVYLVGGTALFVGVGIALAILGLALRRAERTWGALIDQSVV